MSEKACDYCLSSQLIEAYRAPDTQRDLTVYVCSECGLVQSFPRPAASLERKISISPGADFGNLRYGKTLRANADFEIVRKHLRKNIKSVLDIGASRGDFSRLILSIRNVDDYVAIEPDFSLTAWASQEPVRLYSARVEEVDLGEDRSDFVYCSHTLEHLDSPVSVLDKVQRSLKDGGLAFFEVPALETILDTNIVEEFFIDKHNFHFSSSSFHLMLESGGFQHILSGCDGFNLWFLGEKSNSHHVVKVPNLSIWALGAISKYKDNLSNSREKLRKAVEAINQMGSEKVTVIWGAGRIFNAICQAGLDTENVLVADTYLSGIRGSQRVWNPSALFLLQPDTIIVASREYQKEIIQQARQMASKAKVIGWDELL